MTGVVTTAAASLDLSGKFIGASIYSDNASGTAFTVTDADAAFQIVGGAGSDTILGSGFTFTADQRTGIFLNSSVETIADDSGTYTAPYQLTIGDDILPASASNTEVVATSLTLNSGDQLDGGDGHDVLALFGGGTFHLDEVSQFDGFEEVQLKYVNGSGPSEVYLRNGADVYVSSEGGGGAALYFGSGAATSVSMAQSSGGTYHFSDGSATVIGSSGSFESYLFSSGTATVHGRGEFVLSSGDATVFAVGGTNSYYLGDGDYALHGADGKDEFSFTSSSQLANGATLLDGGDGSNDALLLGGQNQVYDLTAAGRASIQNVERIFVDPSNVLKVDDASLVGFASLAAGVVTTAAASLDLSGKFIGASIYSDNASGTAFTVTDTDAALQIVGGAGSDTIVGSGFTFTADQRTGIFLNSSVETIADDSGTYTAPYQLTIGDDILPASASDTEVVATSLTLNSGDQLDGGDGHDVLALFGGGTFRLDEVSQFEGFEEVQLKYVNGSGPSEVYLRNGADVYVSSEGGGGAALYFGSGAATSVSMAQSSGGTYHFSDGSATVIGSSGSFESYLFSSGTATVYGRGEFVLSSGDATVFAVGGTNGYYLGDGDYALHGADGQGRVLLHLVLSAGERRYAPGRWGWIQRRTVTRRPEPGLRPDGGGKGFDPERRTYLCRSVQRSEGGRRKPGWFCVLSGRRRHDRSRLAGSVGKIHRRFDLQRQCKWHSLHCHRHRRRSPNRWRSRKRYNRRQRLYVHGRPTHRDFPQLVDRDNHRRQRDLWKR